MPSARSTTAPHRIDPPQVRDRDAERLEGLDHLGLVCDGQERADVLASPLLADGTVDGDVDAVAGSATAAHRGRRLDRPTTDGLDQAA